MTDSRIRCLFVLHDLAGGGAERVTLNLIRDLDRQRFDPILFLFESRGQFLGDVPRDVRIIVGHEVNGGLLRGRLGLLKNLLSAARESDVLVGALEHQAIFFAAIASGLTGKPVIGWVHKDLAYFASRFSWMQKALYRLVLTAFMGSLDGLVTVSRGVEASLETMVPRIRGRTRVIYNPIDAQRIRTTIKEAAPEWANQVFTKPVVIAAGRLEHVKGFDLLIEAHARLRERGSDHHLLIIGEGSLRESLSALATARGVLDSVFLPGFCDPFPLMARSTVFVLSSRSEGLPTVVIEAMAIELPVIATRCPGGSEELLDSGRCGVLIRPENIEDLTDHLEQMLTSPGAVRPLTHAALAMVENFSPARITAQWELFLGKITVRKT